MNKVILALGAASVIGLGAWFTLGQDEAKSVLAQKQAFTEAKLSLIYSGNIDGELEPCGCSLGGDYGGIARQATYIDEVRSEVGEIALISTGGNFDKEYGNDRIKNEYILKGLAKLNFDAMGMQWIDMQHGVDFLAANPLPWAVQNWSTAETGLGLASFKQFEKQGVKLYFTQWLDPENSPFAVMDESESTLIKDASSLSAQLAKAQARGELVILGTTLTLDDAQNLLPLEHVDILLIEAAYEFFAQPRQVGSTLVLQVGSRGQRLGRLDMSISRGKIDTWQHSIYELPVEVLAAERMEAWDASYNAALKENYLARVALQKQQKEQGSPYAGAEACAACHQQQHDVWLQTDHAGAFEKLIDVNKAFDPHCVACHSVGFMQSGGFLDESITPHLSNVQCENCHGAAAEHAKSAGQVATTNKGWKKEEVCAQCHHPHHSPDFDVETYWPRIQHGL